MRPIGFVKCVREKLHFAKGKIYPYYEIIGPSESDGDFAIQTHGSHHFWNMFLDLKPLGDHHFDFYHPPEFPEKVSEWTEEDWFQYDLKYGE